MSNIEEAAKNFVKGYYLDGKFPSDISDIHYEAEDLFKAGAEWALKNQWISVEEKLPEENKSVILRTSHYFHGEDIFFGYLASKIDWRNNNDENVVFVTHWCPIPELSGKEEAE